MNEIIIPTYNLEIFKGFTCSRIFQYVESDGTTPIPIDEDNQVLAFSIAVGRNYKKVLESNAEDPDEFQSFCKVIDAEQGTFKVLLSDSDTFSNIPLTSETVVGTWWVGLIDTTSVPADNVRRVDPIMNGPVTVVSLKAADLPRA